MADIERSFGFLLHDAARLMRREFERRARCTGLTRAQWQVLAYVSRREGITQAGLADLLDMEPISVTRLVDRLEAAGVVERRPDPGDRRAHNLYLTPAAHERLVEMRGLAAEAVDVALAGFDDNEREILAGLLRRVRGNLSEGGPADTAGGSDGGTLEAARTKVATQ